MKEFKVKFVKNGKEIDTLVIDVDNIEEAKITAETLAHEDGAWWDDIEIKVSEEF